MSEDTPPLATGGGKPSGQSEGVQEDSESVDTNSMVALKECTSPKARECCAGRLILRKLLKGEDHYLLHWSKGFRDFTQRLDVSWICSESREMISPDTLKRMEKTYWLSRIVFLRGLAFVYFFAFLVALNQNQGLIGSNGITPAVNTVNEARTLVSELRGWERIKAFPSLFLLFPASDIFLHVLPLLGIFISTGVLITGASNAIYMLILWVLHMTIVSVWREWYYFGWEAQLLETGFLAIWLCPFWSCSRFPLTWPSPKVCVWGSRWLLFRVVLSAGLIKLRSDDVWSNLTALDYLFETQPLPSILSWYMHMQPSWLHQALTVLFHVVNCGLCFCVVVPLRQCRIFGGMVQLLCQVFLLLGGNMSLSSFLTMVPISMCFDDRFFARMFSIETLKRVSEATKGLAGHWSFPLYQGWPLDSDVYQGSKASEKNPEGELLLSDCDGNRQAEGRQISQDLPRAGACTRLCASFLKKAQLKFAPIKSQKIREIWWKVLIEILSGVAIITCLFRLNNPITYAVWEVLGIFFLALFQSCFSAFISSTRVSFVYTEILLSMATLFSFCNVFSYGPEVWSVWMTSCLLTILVIFAYTTLKNAALVFKIQVEILVATLIIVLSIPVVQNLLSPQQVIDVTFDPFRTVNSYGGFAVVPRERHELIIQGTDAETLDNATTWRNYEFHCKPTDLTRAPCFSTPYHYALDLQMSRVSRADPRSAMEKTSWFSSFLSHLLKNNPSVTKLLSVNPFEGQEPPTRLRVLRSHYRFALPRGGNVLHGPWWEIVPRSTTEFLTPDDIPGAEEHLKTVLAQRESRKKAEMKAKLLLEMEKRRRDEENLLQQRMEQAKREEEQRRREAKEAEHIAAEQEEKRKKEEEEAKRIKEEEYKSKQAEEEKERERLREESLLKKKEDEARQAEDERQRQEAERLKKAQQVKAKEDAQKRQEEEKMRREKAAEDAIKRQKEQQLKEHGRSLLPKTGKAIRLRKRILSPDDADARLGNGQSFTTQLLRGGVPLANAVKFVRGASKRS